MMLEEERVTPTHFTSLRSIRNQVSHGAGEITEGTAKK
jgi:hypothetical protein